MRDPWTWKSLVSKVFLVSESMHVGQASGLAGVATEQGTRAC